MQGERLCDYLNIGLPARQGKPRDRGVCMVIDTGQSVQALEGILRSYGHLIDIAKVTELHLTVPVDEIRRKVQLYREHGIDVQPGGIVLELSRLQGSEATTLDRLRDLGFTAIEVSSSSTAQRESAEDRSFVEAVTSRGFRAIGEVGKKFHQGDKTRFSDTELDTGETIREMQSLLAAGAGKVYWEGHVLRRVMGDTASDILARHPKATGQVMDVVDAVGLDRIVFEVSSMIPYVQRRAQQFWLVRLFGPEVNIGNVRLDEVQFVEHIRLGTWPVFGFGELGDHPYMQALEKGAGSASETWWRDIPLKGDNAA